MKYRAKSLNEIAAHFEELAMNASTKLPTGEHKRETNEMRALRIESATWTKARDILLNTEITKG